LAVVDASSARGEVLRMANPEILHVSAKLEMGEEASPNLPYVSAQIKRPCGVTVRYMDETGAWQEKDLVGLWARSMLHQSITSMGGCILTISPSSSATC